MKTRLTCFVFFLNLAWITYCIYRLLWLMLCFELPEKWEGLWWGKCIIQQTVNSKRLCFKATSNYLFSADLDPNTVSERCLLFFHRYPGIFSSVPLPTHPLPSLFLCVQWLSNSWVLQDKPTTLKSRFSLILKHLSDSSHLKVTLLIGSCKVGPSWGESSSGRLDGRS